MKFEVGDLIQYTKHQNRILLRIAYSFRIQRTTVLPLWSKDDLFHDGNLQY